MADAIATLDLTGNIDSRILSSIFIPVAPKISLVYPFSTTTKILSSSIGMIFLTTLWLTSIS